MIIGVDAGCLGIQDERLAVGVYQVAKNLLQQLSKIDTKNSYYLYSFYPINPKLMHSFGPRMKNIVVMPTKGWMKIWLPLQIAKDNIDIFLALSHVLPTCLPFTKSYKTIALIHDIAFEKFPTMYPESYTKLSKETQKTIWQADTLIAVSQTTKQDIILFYKINPEKITVAYEGIRLLPKGKKQRSKIPYFLFVGAMKQQKNIPTLLQAFDVFLKKTKKQVVLNIVGGDKWIDENIAKKFQTLSKSTQKSIHFSGIVSDQKLADLYMNAIAFVCPSYYEGFGLPFLEAMNSRCPVIGSTAGALPEIIGNAGILVGPDDIDGLAEAMEKVFLHKEIRENMQKKGLEKVQQYSWELFGQKIFSIMATYEK